MESHISPANIDTRAEALEKATKPEPIVPEAKVEAPKVEAPKVEAPKVEAPKVEAKVEAPKVEAPKVEAPKPEPTKSDPELRKWATKISQENAQLREEQKAIKAAIEKLSKKPVDYAALGKDPTALQKHIEAERQEAIAELQKQLTEKTNLAAHNETLFEKTKRENDKVNYPRFEKLFPLIQLLARSNDGRVNWNQSPGAAMDEAYALAETLSPAEAAAVVVPPVAEVAAVGGKTQAEIDAIVAAAVAKAKAEARAEAEEALRNEAAGSGLGSRGSGGGSRRDSGTNTDALKKMPLGDLKKMISPK